MKLALVANRVGPFGGMERASAEVFGRIAQTVDTTVIATQCDLGESRARWIPVRAVRGPAVLNHSLFARSAKKIEGALPYDLVVSVDSAAVDADVVVAHFCVSAFYARHAGLRGGKNPLRRAYQSVVGRLLARHERRLYTSPRLRAVISVSEGLKRELVEQYRIPPSKIHVIPNGVDRTIFHPPGSREAKLQLRRTLQLPERAFIAVFLGGDWERKGLEDAIRAVGRTPHAELVVVGYGDAGAYMRIAAEEGASSRVHFVGMQARPQLYLAAGDVFLCPSRYETFSMSGLEAGACGLPMIVVRTNGLEDFVEDGVNGFFVDTNVESVRARLAEIMRDPARRCAMSQAAVQTATRFDWRTIADETLAVLKTLPVGVPA